MKKTKVFYIHLGKNKHFRSFFLWYLQNEIPQIPDDGFTFEAQSDGRESIYRLEFVWWSSYKYAQCNTDIK